jgi:hypothetical protein
LIVNPRIFYAALAVHTVVQVLIGYAVYLAFIA